MQHSVPVNTTTYSTTLPKNQATTNSSFALYVLPGFYNIRYILLKKTEGIEIFNIKIYLSSEVV